MRKLKRLSLARAAMTLASAMTRRTAAVLTLAVLTTVGAWATPSGNWSDNKAASFSQVDDVNSIITINSEEEFALLAYKVNNDGDNYKNWTIKLGQNLDLSAHYWTPIGKDLTYTFLANFDGGEHTVSGVYVNTTGQYAGLFGLIYLASDQNDYFFKDITVTESEIISTYASSNGHAGGIIGFLGYTNIPTTPTISNCHVTNSVSVTTNTAEGANDIYAAGIVGYCWKSVNLSGCTSAATITTAQTGNCYASGIINLVQLSGNVDISDCKVCNAHITGHLVGGVYLSYYPERITNTGSYYANCTFTSSEAPTNDPMRAFSINAETGVSIATSPSMTYSSNDYYAYNTEVIFNVTAHSGKLVSGLTVTGADNTNISVTKLNDTSFKVNMPYQDITATPIFEDNTEADTYGTFYDGKLAWAVSKKVNNNYTELTISKVGDDNVELPTSITGDTPWGAHAANITTVVIADGINLKKDTYNCAAEDAFDVVRSADMTSLKRIILTKEKYRSCVTYRQYSYLTYSYKDLVYVRPFAGYDTPFCYYRNTDTNTDCYGVRTADDWNEFAEYVNTDANHGSGIQFYLEKDIDFSGKSFTMARLDYGVFDGCKHTISNVTINEPNEAGGYKVGLFSSITDATIKNLKVKDVNITGYYMVGAIAGCDEVDPDGTGHGSTIENCIVDGGTIKTMAGSFYYSYAGGVIGYSDQQGFTSNTTVVKGCYVNNIALETYGVGGGITGGGKGLIRDNYVESVKYTNVANKKRVGGIVGEAEPEIVLKNNYYYPSDDNIMGCFREEGGSEAKDLDGAKYQVRIRYDNNVDRDYGSCVEYDFSKIRAFGDNILSYNYDEMSGKDQTIPVVLTYSGTVPTGKVLAGFSANGGTVTHISGNSYELTPTIRGNEQYSVNTSPIFAESITLANAASNDDVIDNYDSHFVCATLTGRTLFKDGKWNTICLPFDVTIADSPLAGATVMKLKSSESNLTNGTLTLNFEDETMTMTAGTPYIIMWASGDNIVNPVFNGVTIDKTMNNVATSDEKVTFMGSYNARTFNNEDKSILFLGGDNKLYYPQPGPDPNDNTVTLYPSIGACRAYFEITDGTLVRAFNLNFGDGEETQGISDATRLNDKGQMINDGWYNLNGVKVEKPVRKGLYIQNGKKVVIK